MVLLSYVDGDILLLPVGVRHVKNARTWLPTLFYTLLRRIPFKAITFSTSRAIFIAVHVCSGKIHFFDLQKFNLETCTEKPEVDIIMPLPVAEAQFIQWQCNRKQLSHSAEN